MEFTGVTIQVSGNVPLPKFVKLDAMTDEDNTECAFTLTSFAATETEARDQLNAFLVDLIKAIQPS